MRDPMHPTTPAVRRTSARALGLALAGLAVGGAGTASAATAPLVINVAQAPATVDPGVGCLATEVGFISNFYVRLTQYGTKAGPNGTREVDPSTIKPWLARSWKISPTADVHLQDPHGPSLPERQARQRRRGQVLARPRDQDALCGSAFISTTASTRR